MQYKYEAINKNGKMVTDFIQTDNQATAIYQLKERQLLPVKIDEIVTVKENIKSKLFNFSGRVTRKEIAVFTRQLSAIICAGLILTEALEMIEGDMDNAYFRKILNDIHSDINGGTSLSMAMTKYPQVFSKSYVAIIKSGEESGKLHHTMKDLAGFLEKQEELKDRVKSAMSYPAFILGFSLLTGTAVILFLIPRFQEMYSQAGKELPWLTNVVINTSSYINAHLWQIGCALVVLLITSAFLIKTEPVKNWLDRFLFKIPLIGKDMIHKFIITRFCHTLSVLLAGGVELSNSLKISAQVVNHYVLGGAIESVREQVIAGSSIFAEMKKHKIFPALLIKMIAIGERTGNLPEMLRRTAEYYEEEMNQTIKRATSLIEPALIIIVGGFICFVIAALYMPILNVVSLIG